MSSRAGTLTDALARIAHHRPDTGISILDGRGRNVVRRTWAEGQVTEPIELERLHALWRSKGLDTGPMGQ